MRYGVLHKRENHAVLEDVLDGRFVSCGATTGTTREKAGSGA
jgi:hypothetical protein